MSDKTTGAPNSLNRRAVFAGAGLAGAAAVATAVLPRTAKPLPADRGAAPTLAADSGGYRVTDHVLHYYRTARV